MRINQRFSINLAITLFVLSCLSCGRNDPYVYQRTPIVIGSEKVVAIEMRCLKGTHVVGIHCQTQAWNALTNCKQGIKVSIKSTDNPALLLPVQLGYKGSTCDQIDDTHYLFSVQARGNLVVEIVFPNMPAEASPADIIVCKTPAQTDL